MAQAANKQPVMTGLNSPDSSMEFVMLRALRNQKYEVGDELAHSFTVGTERKKNEKKKTKHLQSSSRAAALHLAARRVSTCAVGVAVDWAVLPRQRVLEGIAQVEEAPGDDDVVVKGHVKTHLSEEQKMDLISDISRSRELNLYVGGCKQRAKL